MDAKIYEGKTEKELSKEIKYIENEYNYAVKDYQSDLKLVGITVTGSLVNLVTSGALLVMKNPFHAIHGCYTLLWGILAHKHFKRMQKSKALVKSLKLKKEELELKMPIEIEEITIS